MNDANTPDAGTPSAGQDRWQEYVGGAIGALPRADEELTRRHRRLDRALNGRDSDDRQDRFIWNGTYETGDLFEALQKELAGYLVEDPPTSDLPPRPSTQQTAAKKTSTAKKTSPAKKTAPAKKTTPAAEQQPTDQQGN